MTKASDKRLIWHFGVKPDADTKSRSRVTSKFHFDHRRVRDAKAPKPEHVVTASDHRDLAAAQAKRERKAARA